MKKRAIVITLLTMAVVLFCYFPYCQDKMISPSTKFGHKDAITSTPVESSSASSQQALAAKHATFLRGMAKASNRPIRFYGIVVDQDGRGIPNVNVTVEIRATREPVPGVIGDAFEDHFASTDEQGRFSITDATGALLTIKSLAKEGYEPSKSSLSRAYWYWRSPSLDFHPDETKPEIFKMWKAMGAERLVRKSISASLRYDGPPVVFDLIEGRAAETGDIRVTISRIPVELSSSKSHFQWTVAIDALHGGLIVSDEEQMYLAPAEGYHSSIVVDTPADSANWADEKILRLYAKIRDGKQYARLEIEVLADSRRTTAQSYITSYVNPSGSRNLEYSSALNNSGNKP